MKLNCDIGESYGAWTMGQDDDIMPYIDQANIACGFHGGDPVVIAQTLALAKRHHIDIGAHPSYPDLNGFGRRSMSLSANELKQCLHYQISALAGMAQVQGLTLTYVKPHGALYNDIMANADTRAIVMQTVAEYPLPLTLMVQGSIHFEQHLADAQPYNLPLWFEAFADRCYDDHGFLVSRQRPHALLNQAQMLAQVDQITTDQSVTSENGQILRFPIDTLCVHGDNPIAVLQVQAIRQRIHANED